MMRSLLPLLCVLAGTNVQGAPDIADNQIVIDSCRFQYDKLNVSLLPTSFHDGEDVGGICRLQPGWIANKTCDCGPDTDLKGLLEVDTDLTAYLPLTDNSWLDVTVRFRNGLDPEYFNIGSAELVLPQNCSDTNDCTEPDDSATYFELQSAANSSDWRQYNKGNSFIWINDGPSGEQYMQFQDISLDLVASKLRWYLEWSGSGSNEIQASFFRITGEIGTLAPTRAPTISPTISPTVNPTVNPTTVPTVVPTALPTSEPTLNPTQSPTWLSVTAATTRITSGSLQDSYTVYSDNIFPLWYRKAECSDYEQLDEESDCSNTTNMTYANYVLPDKYNSRGALVEGEDRPWCVTCILAWADIDASIEMQGCEGYNLTSDAPEDPNSWYWCDNGTWVLQTSGRLADWQDSYGRLEIWEVDDNDLKWLQYFFEFNWNDTEQFCFYYDAEAEGGRRSCDTLPLTDGNQYAAMFEFTMPKRIGDVRNSPLIAVWYDVLSIPYSVAPVMGYQYQNLSLYEPSIGPNFGYADVWDRFSQAVIAVSILGACFVAVMALSCFVTGDKKTRKDFMIDTRNLKTTFKHTPETIIVEPHHIMNRAKFNCARHGPWLLVVLVARLMYMFIFSLSFFYLMFRSINESHFNTLDQYDVFAIGRDAQLVNLSQGVELWYANETVRMSAEVENRETFCQDAYRNTTIDRYTVGAKAQVTYHDEQMNNPLGDINFNFSSYRDIYVLGDGNSACSTNEADGAIIWVDKNTEISYTPTITETYVDVVNPPYNATITETTFQNSTLLSAIGYNSEWANFSAFEAIINPFCEEQSWCYGWSFWDSVSGNDAYYMMFNRMAEPPTQEGVAGACFGSVNLQDELDALSINSSQFEDYAQNLQDKYNTQFVEYAEELYNTLSGLWSALQDIDPTSTGVEGNDKLDWTNDWDQSQNLSSSAQYDIDINMGPTKIVLPTIDTSGSDTNYTTLYVKANWVINVGCPDCPAGNFTNQILETVGDFVFNRSDLNGSALPVNNLSNLISVNTALIEFPELPTIELPFDIDFPFDLGWILSITVTLDVLLFVYRWYRTTGIVARIVRGKDVDVSLHYLMVHEAETSVSWCCHGRSALDHCLNVMIWCHDKMNRMSYNLWKVFFWVWYLLKIFILALFVLILYIIVDQVLTVNFIESLGVFQLMTVGLGAQRSVRNQVLCTTALSYNEYTLALMQQGNTEYANERNEDAYAQDESELQRVEEFNAIFCDGWSAYQESTRDVKESKEWVDLNTSTPAEQAGAIASGTYFTYATSNGTADFADIANLFDGDAETFWSPYPDASWLPTASGFAPLDQDISIEFVLSPIYMDEAVTTGWNIEQLTLDWRFEYDPAHLPVADVVSCGYKIEIWSNESWVEPLHSRTSNPVFSPTLAGNPLTRQSVGSIAQYLTFAEDMDTLRLRLTFQDVNDWGSEASLNAISIAGQAAVITCPEVEFGYWEFDGSMTDDSNATDVTRVTADGATVFDWSDGTFTEQCPQITPIHGLMYRGFVRTWLNEQLLAGHAPFINAGRNIALSPFFLIIILIGVLFVAYLFAFIMEWFLMKLDLYRENPYARVPLVTCDVEYDTSMHETKSGDAGVYGQATMDADYYNPTALKDSASNLLDKTVSPTASRKGIEMGLTSDADVTLRGQMPPGMGDGGNINTGGKRDSVYEY